MSRPLPLLLALAVASGGLRPPLAGADRPDVVVADFEGDRYPDGWKTTGTAFGDGPARGTLPGQMAVTGYLGKGLVNSFRGGDPSTGTLTSPEFKLERKYVNLLVGGGKHPGKTCVDLLVGGKVVRTATGPNDRPGGSERLDWVTWDVAEFEGQPAVIRVVDGETGGWGHVNVDHITLSDTKKEAGPVRRTFTVDQPYLHLPVKNKAPMRRVKLVVGGRTVREFDIELATDGQPDWVAFAEVGPFKGKELTVETVLPAGSKALDALALAADVPDAANLYRERHRPLFHFTSRRGWLNDPNGLVYHNGEWHLFYQHNPFGVEWGNMHWGHAVSKDLVRWQELGEALYPKGMDDMAFSGSAVVDQGNTSGWGTKEKPPLVLAYTSTGRGECMAYSTDDGRSWTEYEKNPVVEHQGRDPKLVWYEKGKHWVMAVYDEHDKKQWIAFYTSPDLKAWTFASRIDGFFECPDLFERQVGLEAGGGTKWVLYGADGKYLLGDFDGKTFTPDSEEKKQLWYGNFYAAQTFDNGPPDKYGRPRRVQIGWTRGAKFRGMPFGQQMAVPVELGVGKSDGKSFLPAGSWLVARPVHEVNNLHDGKPVVEITAEGDELTNPLTGPVTLGDDLDTFDLTLLFFSLRGDDGFALDLRGTKLVYDPAKRTLACNGVVAPCLVPGDSGPPTLRVLVDRGSVEVFFNNGITAMSVAAIPDEKNRKVELTPAGKGLVIARARVYRMKSGWGK
ncbi:MAG: glycoside hydrolase family 32 protein [Gemmataceae bacterium]|nr:glycoside hydrolase family 32 protein [Gemmataceae bacterium]